MHHGAARGGIDAGNGVTGLSREGKGRGAAGGVRRGKAELGVGLQRHHGGGDKGEDSNARGVRKLGKKPGLIQRVQHAAGEEGDF